MNSCVLTIFLWLQLVFLVEVGVILVSSVIVDASLMIRVACGCFYIVIYPCCMFALIVVLVGDFSLVCSVFHVLF